MLFLTNSTLYKGVQAHPWALGGLFSLASYLFDFAEVPGDFTEYLGMFFGGLGIGAASFGAPYLDLTNAASAREWL